MSSPEVSLQFDVFLSYQSGDRQWVAQLKSALEGRGIRVWFDQDQILPGDPFVDALEKGLRCCQAVAIIVSPGSLASSWVQDEYQRALTLSNTIHRTLRLIPVLLEDADIPGFLANRQFVDFRSGSQFNQALEQLIKGIRGKQEGAPAIVPASSSPTVASASLDEVAYLERAIERDRHNMRNMLWVWAGALVVGLVLSWVVMSDVAHLNLPSETRIILAWGFPLITLLTAWGATAREWGACREHVKRLACLKDGLEMCRETINPGCGRLHAKFWQVVEREVEV